MLAVRTKRQRQAQAKRSDRRLWNFYLSDALREQLAVYAEQHNVTMASVVVYALAKFLGNDDEAQRVAWEGATRADEQAA